MGPGIIRTCRRTTCRVLLAALTIAAGGCATDGDRPAASTASLPAAPDPEVASPAPLFHEFTNVSSFDVATSGATVHLLMGRRQEDDREAYSLSYARSPDGGRTWSRPAPVATDHGPPARLHRGDDPQIAGHGDRLMAVWTARGNGPFGSGPLAVALSDDGGHSWRPGPVPVADPMPVDPMTAESESTAAEAAAPHAPGASSKGGGSKRPAATGPGFRFPATAAGLNAFHVVWIHAVGDERSLRHARLDVGSDRWSAAAVIDPQICACCWNELKVAEDGSIVALYRDVRPSDMAVARSQDGGGTWQTSARVGQFDWYFEGCPHVGGGLAVVPAAADGGDASPRVLATAWTGRPGRVGAYVIGTQLGRDGTARVAALGAEGSSGRNADVATLPTGHAAVAWDQSAGEGGQAVYVRESANAGRSWGPPRRLSPPDENASYPRLVSTEGRFLALWTRSTDAGEGSLQMTLFKPSAR